jgi:phosphotransferase system HPr-like phosphotransfer protein
MEYSQIYDINRRMHARPYTDVVHAIIDLHEKYDRLEIRLEEPETGKGFKGESIITLLTIGSRSFHLGGKVKVIANGEYPFEILKECADEVGNIFSFKDISRTTWEILYKSEYGHYPDEKPIKK